MRRLVVVAILVIAAAVAYRSYGGEETGTGSLTLPQPAPNPGEAAEPFEATRQDGTPFELSDEGVYVLTFWSSLNRDAAEARPDFAELAREYGDEGATFVAVYISGMPRNAEDAPYAVVQDSSGRLASLYNVKRVPRSFLIEDGTIELVQNGFYPENEDQLKEELARIFDEEEAHNGSP